MFLWLTLATLGFSAQADLADLRTRAARNDGEALNELGNAYANGRDVKQDFAEALRLYGLAAENGVAAAQFNLGMMHELGRGVPPNTATAFQYYERAARQGFAPAQFNVANMYANGVGVKADYFEAALWFRQAADRNIAEAQYNLALAYELGRGVSKDEVAAQRWYRAAAAQGFARAQFNLALMLEEGRGSPPNAAQALELYRAAAAQNFLPAQNNLGIILAESAGGDAAMAEAYVWLALAVENGAKPTGRDIVAAKLTPAKLAEAQVALAQRRVQLSLTDRPAPTEPIVPRPIAPAMPAAGSSPIDPPATPLAAREPSVEAENERLKREVARLAAAAETTAQEKKQLEQKIAAGEARLSSALVKMAAAEAQTKVANTLRLSGETERENIVKELAQAKAAQAAALRLAESTAAELAQLKSAAAPSAGAPMPEHTALLAQLERLTREAATLRTEKADLTRRLNELSTQPAAGRAVSVDTRLVPLQELAVTDRRIAKLIADNARLQEHVKKSIAELSDLSRQLVTPEPVATAKR